MVRQFDINNWMQLKSAVGFKYSLYIFLEQGAWEHLRYDTMHTIHKPEILRMNTFLILEFHCKK